MPQGTPPSIRRKGQAVGLAVAVTAFAVTASVGAPSPAWAEDQPRKPRVTAVDLPPLPVLESAVNPNIGLGPMAVLVRQRVLASIRLLGSLTEGDMIATDGPISVEETPEGGARLTFPELTVRAATLDRGSLVFAVGDLVVEASRMQDGGVEYRYTVPNPITVYEDGTQKAEITFDTLSVRGEIPSDSGSPIMGTEAVTIGDATITVNDGIDEPFSVTMKTTTLNTTFEEHGDGTLQGELVAKIQGIGLTRGEHEPTIAIAGINATYAFDSLPSAVVDYQTALLVSDPMLSEQDLMQRASQLTATEVTGNVVGHAEMTGFEVYLSPTDSVAIDRIGMGIEVHETPGDIPSGESSFRLDGLRTKGQTLPVLVDLGALRMSVEGEGLDAPRLRGFLAEYLSAFGPILALESSEQEDQIGGVMEGLIPSLAKLVREMGIGKGASELALSGLNVRQQGTTVFGIDTLELTGGWDEDDRGRLNAPSNLVMTGLQVNDPEASPPVRVGQVVLDSMTEGYDLRVAREMAAQALETIAGTGMDGLGNDGDLADVQDMMAKLEDLNATAAVAGGTVTLTIEDVAVGSPMNPLGGLAGLTFTFGMTPAEPGVDVADANLSLSMTGLDAGPMAALAAPLELIPTEAALALDGSDLPLPALSRFVSTNSVNPDASEDEMLADISRLLEANRPVFDLRTLTMGAPAYGVNGNGQVAVSGLTPQQAEGTIRFTVNGMNGAMALLQERVKTDPSMQQPLMGLVALRGMGRPGAPGTYLYDIELSPQAGVLVNGLPVAAMMEQQPGQGGPAPQ